MSGERQYFGTDGIRGRFGDRVINPEFMLKLGWSVGKILAKDSRSVVLIGRDTRISGSLIEAALQVGLVAAGVDVLLLGVLPTPAIAYLTRVLDATAGIVISASHNPFFDNGVKLFNHEGMKISDELELAIEQQFSEPMVSVPAVKLGQVKVLEDAAKRYINFCTRVFPADLSLQGMQLIVDCAQGAAVSCVPAVFSALGAQVITINNQPNGCNINDHCGATNVAQLQKAVVSHQGGAVGIAFDGDGDRLIMVDHKGEQVDGDEILCILATQGSRLEKACQGIVGTVMSNLGLELALAELRIPFVRTPVGDRFVLEELKRRNWVLGGESSGHIVDLRHTTTGDGIITALLVLSILQRRQQSLHTLKQMMTKRPQILLNVPINIEQVDINQYPQITQAVVDAEATLGGRGRVLLRPSGTEPLVRVMVEGDDKKMIKSVAESLAATVTQVFSGMVTS